MVTAKALQKQLTAQISMWSVLALQDNPLMPVINNSLFQETVGATFTHPLREEDR